MSARGRRKRSASIQIPTAMRHRPCSYVGPGEALARIPNLDSPRGSGAPADAGVCETPGGWPARPPGGTLCEGVPSLLSERGASRRSTAALCDQDGPRFRERGPATPVSQLLAAGPGACERSPAIARELRSALLQSPRRRIDRATGISPDADPVRSRHISALPHRRSVFTASHDDAPSRAGQTQTRLIALVGQ
jgi:hypothetical protein